MKSKRAFILGAGFSKQAGMPLATELTSLILEDTELKDHEEMQAWQADLKRRLVAAEGADPNDFRLNIEQLFDFAKYDEELWRMKQQLSPVGREYGDTPWNTAEGISTWLDYMAKELYHVIWDAQKQANVELIKRFTDQLSDDDRILSFNYDTLVETALSATGRKWNHGLNDHEKGGVTILKMHGSVDWILLERRPENQLENFVKLFSKTDTNGDAHKHQMPQEDEYAWELWRAKDTCACNAIIEWDKSGLSNFRYFPGLAGLGRYKPLHALPGSAQTWFTAFQALRSVEEMYIVGFSMSPYDTMARFHFTSVIQGRLNPPSKVVIIDPNALRLAQPISVVFGRNLTLMAHKAEEVDWQRTFGG